MAAAEATGLGTCMKCHGPLCISNRMVACDNCGCPHPDHEVSKQIKEAQKVPPPAPKVNPLDYVASDRDRIKLLEEQHQQLSRELVDIKAILAQKRQKG